MKQFACCFPPVDLIAFYRDSMIELESSKFDTVCTYVLAIGPHLMVEIRATLVHIRQVFYEHSKPNGVKRKIRWIHQ